MSLTIDRCLRWSLVGLLTTAVAACSVLEPQADHSEFYVLTSVSEVPTNVPPAPVGLVVGVGPIEFPDYLDRSERVVRVGVNQVRFSDNERWAEPLERNFARVLAQNLSVLLDTGRIYVFPWFTSLAISHEVKVDVLQFDTDRDGDATLRVRWALRAESSEQVVISKESRFEQPSRGSGPEGAVQALSEAVGQLASEIATAVYR